MVFFDKAGIFSFGTARQRCNLDNMKILHLGYSPDGGSGQVVNQLVLAQKRLGHASVAKTSVPSGGLANNLTLYPNQTASALIDNWIIRRGRLHKSPFSILRKSLPKFSMDAGWDIVHVHGTSSPISSPEILAVADSGIPVIQTLHDINAVSGGCHLPSNLECFGRGCVSCPVVRQPFKDLVRRRREEVNEALTKQNIHLVAVSEAVKRALGSLPAEISVVPNPIRDEFHPQRLTRVPSAAITILFVANKVNDPWKNLNFAKAVVAELAALGSFAQLRIVGQSNASQQRELNEIFLGSMSALELAQEYANASVLLIPSLGETFSLTAHEAAMMGCPSICLSERLGPPLEDLGGFRCEGQAEVARRIVWIAQTEYRVSKSIQKRVALNNSPETVALKYLSLYERLIPQRETGQG